MHFGGWGGGGGRNLSSSLQRSVCLFHSGTSPFVSEKKKKKKNEVSIIFVAAKKNDLHKILAVATVCDQAADVIKVIFLY